MHHVAALAGLLIALHLSIATAADNDEDGGVSDPEVIEVENLITRDLAPRSSQQNSGPVEAWTFTEAEQFPQKKKRPKSSSGNDSLKISVKSKGRENAEPPPEEIYDTKIRMVRVAPKIEPVKNREQRKSATAKDQNFKIILVKTAPPPDRRKEPAKSRRPASIK